MQVDNGDDDEEDEVEEDPASVTGGLPTSNGLHLSSPSHSTGAEGKDAVAAAAAYDSKVKCFFY